MDAVEVGNGAETLTDSRQSLWRSVSLPLSPSSPTPSKSHNPKKPAFKIDLPKAVQGHGSNAGTCNLNLSCACIKVITPPPEELPDFNWTASKMASTASSSTVDPASSESVSDSTEQDPQSNETESSKSMSPRQSQSPIRGASGDALADAVDAAVSSLDLENQKNNTFKLVTQILPCPTPGEEGYSVTAALDLVVNSLQSHPSNPARWLHITHALPERSPVKDLPTSPPSTPSASVASFNQNDYFANTRNIINTAAIMVDRHNCFAARERSIIPSAPALVSPPASTDVSLYERIIPPSTAQEFHDLFEPSRPSGLVDRLTELAHRGSLIFIYPTKAGADTFQSRYLNPALDPLIRSVVFGKGLPAESCAAIGRLESALYMLSFDNLRSRLDTLLQKLNSAAADSANENNDDKNPPSLYSLAYASEALVDFRDKPWEKWWTHQEAARIRAVMEQYFKRMGHGPFYKDEHFTATGLAREVLEGLASRRRSRSRVLPPGSSSITSSETGNGTGTGTGTAEDGSSSSSSSIEIGVFVIKRGA